MFLPDKDCWLGLCDWLLVFSWKATASEMRDTKLNIDANELNYKKIDEGLF